MKNGFFGSLLTQGVNKMLPPCWALCLLGFSSWWICCVLKVEPNSQENCTQLRITQAVYLAEIKSWLLLKINLLWRYQVCAGRTYNALSFLERTTCSHCFPFLCRSHPKEWLDTFPTRLPRLPLQLAIFCSSQAKKGKLLSCQKCDFDKIWGDKSA